MIKEKCEICGATEELAVDINYYQYNILCENCLNQEVREQQAHVKR